ncbi:MAG: SCO family protein [Nitriliruptoraceae bacterium]
MADGRRGPGLMVAAGVVIAMLAIVAAVSSLGRTAALPGVVRDPVPQVHGMTFLDHGDPQGAREVDLLPPEGHLTLLYFGYLSCPDICPMTMVDISRAQDRIGTELAARTQVAFVTVDPARDEPARLRDYLSLFFDGDFLALTAPDERVLDRARDELGLRYEIEPHEPGAESYDVAHSALIYVIDDRATVVRELPFGSTVEDIALVLEAALT